MSTTPAIDFESLTMGEIAQLEELSGLSLSQFGDDDKPKARFMTALAYLVKRRQDPTFSHSQAEALTLADITAIVGGEDSDEGEGDAS